MYYRPTMTIDHYTYVLDGMTGDWVMDDDDSDFGASAQTLDLNIEDMRREADEAWENEMLAEDEWVADMLAREAEEKEQIEEEPEGETDMKIRSEDEYYALLAEEQRARDDAYIAAVQAEEEWEAYMTAQELAVAI